MGQVTHPIQISLVLCTLVCVCMHSRVCSSVPFITCVDSCNQHHNQDKEMLHQEDLPCEDPYPFTVLFPYAPSLTPATH